MIRLKYLATILLCLYVQTSDEIIQFTSPAQLQDIQGDAFQFMFVGQKSLTNVTGQLVAADPIYACGWEDIKNKEEIAGNILLVRRGM